LTQWTEDRLGKLQEGYNQFSCKVLHNCQLTTPFETKSGVRQGCLLSPLLFLVVLDKVLRASLDGKARSIRWKLTETLEDWITLMTSAYFTTVKNICKESSIICAMNQGKLGWR
jgi:hypothetical protein